jgi:hypothetical protein
MFEAGLFGRLQGAEQELPDSVVRKYLFALNHQD